MKQTKRFYEAPAMQVVELKARQTLLTMSNEGTNPQKMEEVDLGEY